MKIRSYRRRVDNMLNWLNEQLTKEFLINKWNPYTPAGMERAERLLRSLQVNKSREEPQVPEWTFPLVIAFSAQGSFLLDVHPTWESENVLYLDFDTYKSSILRP